MENIQYSQEMLKILMRNFLQKYIIENKQFLEKLQENKIDINSIPEIFEIINNCNLEDFEKITIIKQATIIKYCYNEQFISKFIFWEAKEIPFEEVENQFKIAILDF